MRKLPLLSPLFIALLALLPLISIGGESAGKNRNDGELAQLPAPIKTAIALNFPRAKIIKVIGTDTPSGYEYAIDFIAGKDTLVLFFTESSMILSSTRTR
jgi:hypothetical protein